jgi:hypothetical protein
MGYVCWQCAGQPALHNRNDASWFALKTERVAADWWENGDSISLSQRPQAERKVVPGGQARHLPSVRRKIRNPIRIGCESAPSSDSKRRRGCQLRPICCRRALDEGDCLVRRVVRSRKGGGGDFHCAACAGESGCSFASHSVSGDRDGPWHRGNIGRESCRFSRRASGSHC